MTNYHEEIFSYLKLLSNAEDRFMTVDEKKYLKYFSLFDQLYTESMMIDREEDVALWIFKASTLLISANVEILISQRKTILTKND